MECFSKCVQHTTHTVLVSLNLMCNFESHTEKEENVSVFIEFCLVIYMSHYNLNIIVSKALYHHKNENKSEAK